VYVAQLKEGMLLVPTGDGQFVCFHGRESLSHVYWMQKAYTGFAGPFVYLGHKRVKKRRKDDQPSNKTQLIREVLTPQGIKKIYGHDFRYLKPLKED